MKYRILIVMNCASDEMIRYFSTNKLLMQDCQIIKISTYHNPPANYIDFLKSSDIVITQDVRSIEHYTFDFITRYVSNHCIVYRLAFWRFDGLWVPPHNHFREALFYSLDEYITNKDSYKLKFYEDSLSKFKEIERNSCIKLCQLIENPKNGVKFFTDNWHPKPILFFYVIHKIILELGYQPPQSFLFPTGINQNRHRLIPDNFFVLFECEKEEILFWLDRYISRDLYIDFLIFLQNEIGYHNLNFSYELNLFWYDYLQQRNIFSNNKLFELNKISETIHDSSFIELTYASEGIEIPDCDFKIHVTSDITFDESIALGSSFYGLNPLGEIYQISLTQPTILNQTTIEQNLTQKMYKYSQYLYKLLLPIQAKSTKMHIKVTFEDIRR